MEEGDYEISHFFLFNILIILHCGPGTVNLFFYGLAIKNLYFYENIFLELLFRF